MSRAAAAVLLAAALVAGTSPAAAAPGAPHDRAVPAVTRDEWRDREYWLDAYGIREAWTVTRGAGVTIAIIDSGIARGVRELDGAVIGGADFSGVGAPDGRTPIGSGTDRDHGTMVAVLAAGRGTGAGSGILGSAPEASLLSASIGFRGTSTGSDEQIADAIIWAVDQGADVINLSLTRNVADWPRSWDRAFLHAAEHDVVVVAAAGNRGSGTTGVSAPATIPGVLTVAGVRADQVASWNSSTQGITLGVAAPSERLVGVTAAGRYVMWSGTSGAAPIVAGIVGLVRAAHPELDAANVIQRILATARDRGDPGPDLLYGYGLVDAAAAVRADVPLVEANPAGDLAEWVRIHRRATATPQPMPTPDPTPDAAPVPPDAALPDPVGLLLPSPTTLQLVGLPLLVLVAFGAVTAGIALGAVRQFRSTRRR